MDETNTIALVFSGGFGLGAYHAGAYEAFSRSSQRLHWITGASAGAITAALVAGGPPEQSLARLSSYWNHSTFLQACTPNPGRHAFGWMEAITARLFGSAGHFRPRLPLDPFAFRSFYDLGPTKDRLRKLIDFSRLNAAEQRVTIVATDLKTGDPALFDSLHQPIELDHILASCGFLPEFAPMAIGGRWVGDGGLSLNAPFDPVLEEAEPPLRAFIVDLYARDAALPDGLEAALERKNDLMFGNQTFQRLRYAVNNRALRFQLQGRGVAEEEIYLLSYRPGREEAGPEKSFDFSQAAIAQRWRAGFLDMQHAATTHKISHGIRAVRRQPGAAVASHEPDAPVTRAMQARRSAGETSA